MSFVTNKIAMAGVGALPGQPGSLWGAPVSQALVSGTPYVLPIGDWLVTATANVTIEIQTSAGVWTNIQPAGTGGTLVRSDGVNVQLSASASETAIIIPYN